MQGTLTEPGEIFSIDYHEIGASFLGLGDQLKLFDSLENGEVA